MKKNRMPIGSNGHSRKRKWQTWEVDPDLAEQLLDVVREFDNPTL